MTPQTNSPWGYTPVASVDWRGRTLHNTRHDDIYFNPDNGFAESEHVFVHGNALPERFGAGARQWVIAETGFGTGLNFLTSWLYWQQHAHPESRLTYIAFEACPLANNQIARAVSAFPQLAQYLDRLLDRLPPLIAGSYPVALDDRVELILHYHPAEKIFPRLVFAANAWYLDGFAPSRNPELWTTEICSHISRCSAPGATLASYSVAGHLRQSLADCGFVVRKAPGFGNKQHMLQASLPEVETTARNSISNLSNNGRIAVIGAGFAGCSSAAALSGRGYRVDLYESADRVASRASANRSAVLHYKPEPLHSASQQLKWAAYVYALSLYSGDCHFSRKPIVLAPKDKRGLKWLQRWKAAYRQRAIQGYFEPHSEHGDGLLFTRAGTVDLSGLSDALIRQKLIRLITDCEITAIETTSQGFVINHQEYDQIIVAVNAGIQGQLNRWNVSVGAFKGQISYYPTDSERNQQADQGIYCSSVFLNKGIDDWQIGGGFIPDFSDLEPDPQLLKKTQESLASDFPKLSIPQEPKASWCDIRTSGRDHLPLVGKLAVHPKLPDAAIYANLAQGGKGSLMIPLCSRMLADALSNQIHLPCWSLVDPGRFNR